MNLTQDPQKNDIKISEKRNHFFVKDIDINNTENKSNNNNNKDNSNDNNNDNNNNNNNENDNNNNNKSYNDSERDNGDIDNKVLMIIMIEVLIIKK